MAEILINNVKKSYGKTEVIHGASFKINDGELVVIVGPSGCGKSTVTQLLERFYDVDDGQLLISGNPIQNYDVHYIRAQIDTWKKITVKLD